MTGEDAFSYLQSQVAQDLSPLGQALPGAPAWVHTYWLNQKGKIEGESLVIRDSGDAFFVLGFGMDADRLHHLIARHVIADDVEVEPLGGAYACLVLGLRDPTLLDMETLNPGLPRVPEWQLAGRGFCCFGPSNALKELRAVFTSKLMPEIWSESRFHFERIGAGIPVVPEDLSDSNTPFDIGPRPHGVHFNKGCYLGQEVMAKMRATGGGTRSLVALEARRPAGDPEFPESGPVFLPTGEKAGDIRSSSRSDDRFRCMALVRRRMLDLSDRFHLGSPEGPPASLLCI